MIARGSTIGQIRGDISRTLQLSTSRSTRRNTSFSSWRRFVLPRIKTRMERAKRFNSNDRLHWNPFSRLLCSLLLFLARVDFASRRLSSFFPRFQEQQRERYFETDWYFRAIVYSISCLLSCPFEITTSLWWPLDERTNRERK